MRLEGKTALITGAASGIGAAAVQRFVDEGCRVCLGDIQVEQGRALAEQCGNGSIFVACDVTDEDAVAAAVDTAVEAFGHLDIVFHSAGIVGAVGPVATTPGDEWRFSIDVLLNGTFYAIKHAARVMQPRSKGSIITMASTAGT